MMMKVIMKLEGNSAAIVVMENTSFALARQLKQKVEVLKYLTRNIVTYQDNRFAPNG